MARVTSKYQVTVPRAIAAAYGITPGTEIEWLPAGEAIRVVPPAPPRRAADPARRLQLFDAATERHRARQAADRPTPGPDAGRGWTREELYTDRGVTG